MKKYLFTFLCIFVCTVLFAQETSYQWARDLSYTSSDDAYARERCKLDVYYPQDAKDCPVVVWFHGGGLTGGSKEIPAKLRESGLVVVGVNYRLLPKGGKYPQNLPVRALGRRLPHHDAGARQVLAGQV